ncbi:hypothetical protein CD351_03960 [Erythrobacter sp. KY5]|uniref:hypothetical protein n=1 Tax=Erythrobacter sp. KY5 TaxID=2011159 RepID=UPI000DBF0C78|nr:hypothetical protein [Erythrobacter sp. KY5]AWW73581.1 hypothetical protein CD351_03960 [Erythrobacter sp. KY5]
MSFTAALLLIAQSAAPLVSDAPMAQSSAAPSGGVSIQASASARIIRATRIAFDRDSGIAVEGETQASTLQRSRDAAGTYWVEFS